MLNELIENSVNTFSTLVNEAVDAEYYQTMVSNIYKDSIRYGLFYNIADVQVMKSPVGLVFARVENTDGSFQIKSVTADVTKDEKSATDSHVYQADITPEALEDLLKLSNYGSGEVSTTPELFENFVKSMAGFKETQVLLKRVKAEAFDASLAETAGGIGKTLSLTGDASENGETNLFYIHKFVNECILKMNQDNYRTYDAFCILPSKNVGGILGLGSTYSKISQQGADTRAHDYLLTTINNVRYYINPDKTETEAIVGLHSSIERGISSLIYCPFGLVTSHATDANNGKVYLRMNFRSDIVVNPIHSKDHPMLMKFTIN